MAIPGSAGPFLLAQLEEEGGYEIERSLRFNSSDSAYLSRTPASAGNRKTWTWAGWVKRSNIGTDNYFFGCNAVSNATQSFYFAFGAGGVDAGALSVLSFGNFYRKSTALFRDPSAWYHIVVTLDTTQATAANRIRIYVNGNQLTSFSLSSDPTQNADLGINQASQHVMGNYAVAGGTYFPGYLADVHFIDGQALTPSSFGKFDTNGVWQPIDASGLTYGTNGFHLPFSDNSTAAALGTDSSGNSNTWTVNNISVTAGAGNDSLVDSPTNYGEDTGAGGEVRGNYCTWNPLGTTGPASSNGNLDIALSSTSGNKIGTILLTSGKWYWECVGNGYAGAVVGVGGEGFTSTLSSAGSKAIGYWSGGGIYWDGGSFTSGIASYTTSDVIGIAVDMTAGTVAFYKNNSLVYTATFGSGTVPNLSSGVYPGFNTGNPSGTVRTVVANFGQRQWAYAAPAGFKALTTTNLPEPTIADGSTAMDVALYTGNGSTQTISGLNFSPDLVWLKSRSAAFNHRLIDQVQGNTSTLASNLTTAAVDCSSDFTGFTASGFSVSYTASFALNNASQTYVAWTWDAGSSTVTNPDGSISSQVRANASAGFSVVTWTGTGALASIGHGLGVAPKFAIIKNRSSSIDWYVTFTILSSQLDYMALNTTAASAWTGVTPPTSSIFNLGTGASNNASGANYVGYFWAPVAGYSSFGSYTGNGSADGPFVFCNFRPAVVLVKMSSSTGNWTILDDKREGYNVDNDPLFPNLANAEGTTDLIDITSNGFKVRTTDATFNTNAGTYIYAAWASSPFAYSRAR